MIAKIRKLSEIFPLKTDFCEISSKIKISYKIIREKNLEEAVSAKKILENEVNVKEKILIEVIYKMDLFFKVLINNKIKGKTKK